MLGFICLHAVRNEPAQDNVRREIPAEQGERDPRIFEEAFGGTHQCLIGGCDWSARFRLVTEESKRPGIINSSALAMRREREFISETGKASTFFEIGSERKIRRLGD
ncbi:MAG TPA: hypothetical protein VFZ59_06045 [Verrucomicrobiae bacterium]|nr:hypothetical protein [Verrucomicrobiae bacterium]